MKPVWTETVAFAMHTRRVGRRRDLLACSRVFRR